MTVPQFPHRAMLPKAILFDLDDTLFDHQRSSRLALQAVHAHHAVHTDFDAFAKAHAEVLEIYHRRFLAGELSLDEARVARMIDLFARFGLSIDNAIAQEVGALYRRQHLADRALLPGARELLEALAGRATLGIVSNNSSAEQFAKLRTLGIAHFFDAIVISEDAGAVKPERRIFDMALERAGAKAHETVMVGDNWHADVMGATAAGIGAVWLNRQNETPASTRISSQKWLENRANAGVSNSPQEIASLLPTALALDAIQNAFKKDTLGTKESQHAELETLAP